MKDDKKKKKTGEGKPLENSQKQDKIATYILRYKREAYGEYTTYYLHIREPEAILASLYTRQGRLRRRYLTQFEVSQILGVRIRVVRRLCWAKKLIRSKPRGVLMIDASSLATFLTDLVNPNT